MSKSTWFRAPSFMSNPGETRINGFSAVPSRAGFFHDEDLNSDPLDSSISGNVMNYQSNTSIGPMDMSSSYNFDMPQNYTSFMFGPNTDLNWNTVGGQSLFFGGSQDAYNYLYWGGSSADDSDGRIASLEAWRSAANNCNHDTCFVFDLSLGGGFLTASKSRVKVVQGLVTIVDANDDEACPSNAIPVAECP